MRSLAVTLLTLFLLATAREIRTCSTSDDPACLIDCANRGAESCQEANLHCREDGPCEIECKSTSSCNGTVVLCPRTGTCSIRCEGDGTCEGMAVFRYQKSPPGVQPVEITCSVSSPCEQEAYCSGINSNANQVQWQQEAGNGLAISTDLTVLNLEETVSSFVDYNTESGTTFQRGIADCKKKGKRTYGFKMFSNANRFQPSAEMFAVLDAETQAATVSIVMVCTLDALRKSDNCISVSGPQWATTLNAEFGFFFELLVSGPEEELDREAGQLYSLLRSGCAYGRGAFAPYCTQTKVTAFATGDILIRTKGVGESQTYDFEAARAWEEPVAHAGDGVSEVLEEESSHVSSGQITVTLVVGTVVMSALIVTGVVIRGAKGSKRPMVTMSDFLKGGTGASLPGPPTSHCTGAGLSDKGLNMKFMEEMETAEMELEAYYSQERRSGRAGRRGSTHSTASSNANSQGGRTQTLICGVKLNDSGSDYLAPPEDQPTSIICSIPTPDRTRPSRGRGTQPTVLLKRQFH